MKHPNLVILGFIIVVVMSLAGSAIGFFVNNIYEHSLATATVTAQNNATANAIAFGHTAATTQTQAQATAQVQAQSTAQAQTHATATAVARIPTPTPKPPPPAPPNNPPATLNTAWDLYYTFEADGLANTDGSTLPNSWWDCCVTYHPGDASVLFSDTTSGDTIVVALFYTASGASTDASQESNDGWSYYQDGRCLLLTKSGLSGLSSYEPTLDREC